MALPRRSVFQSRTGYALAVCAELGAPVLRFLSARVTGAQTPPSQWRRGLILGHTHIGDVLFRTASLPQLARALPECEWHYLATAEGAQLHGRPSLFTIVKSLFTVVNTDSDDGVGDERTVAAVLVKPFQTACHHLHGGVAVGE